MKNRLFIVDVFAERRYAGNQLAVVVVEAGLASMGTEHMQAIAAEMNYSETTFVQPEPDADGHFAVRIFTPSEELPFAGHPTLGTAAVLGREVLADPVSSIVLSTGIGPVEVRLTADATADVRATMRPPQPEQVRRLSRDDVAGLAGLTIEDCDADFEPCLLRIGIGMVLLPVRDGQSLERAALNLPAWQAAAAQLDKPTGLYLVSRDTAQAENTLAARSFFDALGAREDPATGSAGACLAAWLGANNYLGPDRGSPDPIRVEQGYSLGRPSILHLGYGSDADGPWVEVGGGVLVIVRGTIV